MLITINKGHNPSTQNLILIVKSLHMS